jgi:hypothetical protein
MKKLIFICAFLIWTISSFSQTVIYSSDFTSPSTWSGWTINTFYFDHYFTIPPHGSIAFINEGDVDDSCYQVKLVSPQIDLSIYSSAYVALSKYFLKQTYNGKTESLEILASTDGGLTWTMVKDITGSTDWQREYADISAFCENPNVKIAVQYSDDNGWLYGAGVDDVLVCTMQTNDAALMNVNKQDFWLVNDPYPLKILMQNYGTNTITSAVVNYSVDGGTIQTDNISGLNLAPLDTVSFVHSVPWIPSAGGHNVTVWIESVNGLSDQNNANDTLNFALRNTVSSVPEKKILIDWIKSTECSLCMHGSAIIDSIISEHPSVIIPVSLYDYGLYGSYELIFDSIYSGPYPSYSYAGDDYYYSCMNDASWLSRGYIDKVDFDDVYGKCIERLEMPGRVNKRLEYVTPVSISASFSLDTLTRIINADVTATFFADLQGDFRFNDLILKDSINFIQSNFFTNPNRYPFVNIQAFPSCIHNHILVQSFGGRYGTEGSLPLSVTDGNSYTWHYTDTLKEHLISDDHLSLVFMVVEYDSISGNSVVFNSVSLQVDTLSTGVDPQEGYNSFIVYPNPVSDELNIEFKGNKVRRSFEIFNSIGQIIFKGTLLEKTIVQTTNFARGVYLVKLENGRSFEFKKILKE